MNWKKVKLKEVLKQYRVQHIVQDDIEYKQVTISKYDGVTFRGTKIGKDIGRKRQFVIDLKNYPNTLMLVRQGVQDGSIGIAPLEVDGCIATENMPMFSIEGIDLEYLRFLLKSPYFYDELNKIETTGSAQKSIHERQILGIEIPLLNIEDQKQFVKELTKLKSRGIEISTELTYQLDLIKQLRQAFLREAMQGKLVKSKITKETGQQLLEKIKTEKAQLIAEKKLKKEKELPPIPDDEIPFEIPKHWALTRIENIAANEKNALKAGPFGSSLKKEFYVKKGFKIYGQEQVISNDPFFGNYYIDENRFKSLKSCEVKTGDILISLVGTMGKVLILPDGIEKGIINPRLVKISFYKDINREFFKYYLYSEIAVKQINHLSHGSTMNIINLGIIKKLIFPLPPLHEQEQIVAKLLELMAFCDGLEQSIKESQGYNEMLLQQVLREALQGEVEV
jgi:type I restriction enzyme S subunit